MADGVELAPSSLAELHRLAAAYKGGDKALQKRLRTGIQSAAKPLAEKVIKEGSAEMPARGGLRARLLASRPGITAALGGRTVSVSVRISNKQKDSLGGLNAGTLKHPVYKTGVWVSQSVPSGTYDAAFKRGAPDATDRVNAEIAKGLSEIAAEA